MRDWVDGLEFVTADGEIEWTERGTPSKGSRATRELADSVAPLIRGAAGAILAGYPRTTKNSAGYALDAFLNSGDAVDLLVGSEGTLGIVTRAEFKLDPTPPYSATLLVALDDIETLTDVIRICKRFDPTTTELLDRTFLDLDLGDAGVELGDAVAVVLVELEGNHQEEVLDGLAAAARELEHFASKLTTAVTTEEAERLWSIRRGASHLLTRLPEPTRSLQIIEDGCVPVDGLGEYLKEIKTAASDLGIEVVAFGHAGDGHLHVNALVDSSDPALSEKLERLLDRVTEKLIELGGTPSGEHGDGRMRAPYLEHVYGPEIVSLFRAVKDCFDPAGIMNPGVIVAEPGRAVHDLKVGPGAVEIPRDIAAALRQMEQDASWGNSFEISGLASP